MKRKLCAALAVAAVGVLASGPAYAGFMFGDETKGVTITNNESDLNIRIRLQPRLDFGDLIENGSSYESQSDLYLRRARIELGGNLLTKTIQYNLTLNADKYDDKTVSDNKVGLLYAYLRWVADEACVFTFGKEKLPYSRISLTSSARQLIIDRPVSTEEAKKVFGKTDAYYQPKFSIGGKLSEGLVGYEVAIADGWQNSEALSGDTVLTASPLFVGRVELSPPGWAEKSKSDAHLGNGQHLTFGMNIANQSGIEFTNGFEEDRTLWGFDVSGHYNGLTAQFEYNQWEIDSTEPGIAKAKPTGWYAQAGYFIDGLNVEPVARYEVFDHDSEAADQEETVTTLGVNWYGKGHSFKVGANWVHYKFDTGAEEISGVDSKDLYQVQAQLYY